MFYLLSLRILYHCHRYHFYNRILLHITINCKMTFLIFLKINYPNRLKNSSLWFFQTVRLQHSYNMMDFLCCIRRLFKAIRLGKCIQHLVQHRKFWMLDEMLDMNFTKMWKRRKKIVLDDVGWSLNAFKLFIQHFLTHSIRNMFFHVGYICAKFHPTFYHFSRVFRIF